MSAYLPSGPDEYLAPSLSTYQLILQEGVYPVFFRPDMDGHSGLRLPATSSSSVVIHQSQTGTVMTTSPGQAHHTGSAQARRQHCSYDSHGSSSRSWTYPTFMII